MSVFSPDWDGPPFELFGREHLIALTLVVLFQVVLLWRFQDADAATKARVRWGLVAALWAQEISFHVWRLVAGTWTPKEMLPLHLCSQAVWLGGLALLTRGARLASYVYFTALAGASQALATPDAGPYGWPHYRFVQFFVSHGLIVAVPLWLSLGEGLRPTRGGLAAALVGTVASGLALIPLNRRIGSNYMFSARKPDSASLLDKLPPWPRYIPVMALLVAAAYGALYAPWAVADARRQAWV